MHPPHGMNQVANRVFFAVIAAARSRVPLHDLCHGFAGRFAVLAGAKAEVHVGDDDEVVAVKPDGTVAWHTAIPDPHPEIEGPHILSVYGDTSTVDVSVDSKVPGAAPDFVGGSIVKLSNATGGPTSTRNTFRPAAPLGYAPNGLVVTGEVIDDPEYGDGRTITIDTPGNGRRIIRNAVGTVQKPAMSGDQLVVAVGSSIDGPVVGAIAPLFQQHFNHLVRPKRRPSGRL